MRKKDLLVQNAALFDRLQQSEICIKRLRRELEEKERLIADFENDAFPAVEEQQELGFSVKTEIDDLSEPCEAPAFEESSDLNEEEPSAVPQVQLDDVTEYGAKAIGKLVVASAEYSNQLTQGGNTAYRELVNLLLGRTEVAKSEILTATIGEGTLEEKTAAIDEICDKALEYFESVMAQINDEKQQG